MSGRCALPPGGEGRPPPGSPGAGLRRAERITLPGAAPARLPRAPGPRSARAGYFPAAMNIDLRVSDALDVAIVAGIVFAGLVWLRRSRARFAALGLALVALLYLLVSRLEFQLTAWILQGFLAIVVFVTVVVFQEDLRRLFERIAVLGLGRRSPAPPPDAVDTIARTLSRLAARRTGALVVLPGREPLDRHLEGGVVLDGRVSEPLILSLFDTSSPGHDGAAVVRGDRVERFAVHLPLSTDRAQLDGVGTRHAAALGLAERCDALCLVVSEERGAISVARDGELRVLRGSEERSEEHTSE